MQRRIHRALGVLIVALGVLAGAGCRTAPTRPHVSLDPSLAELRTQFNADAGRTRVLMIVAPT